MNDRPANTNPRFGSIILCGGKSSRMGRPKLELPFGNELLLQRVIRLVRTVINPVVVVAAEGQTLPELPANVWVVRDQHEGRGPLEGLSAGLACIQQHNLCDAIFATSCDVPLLRPEFIQQMMDSLHSEDDAAVPVEEKFFHPLAAVYRVSILPTIQRLLSQDQLRPAFLFSEVPTRRIPIEDLRTADPQLHSLLNCNRWEDYQLALQWAGLPPVASEE